MSVHVAATPRRGDHSVARRPVDQRGTWNEEAGRRLDGSTCVTATPATRCQVHERHRRCPRCAVAAARVATAARLQPLTQFLCLTYNLHDIVGLISRPA